jgi:hypothetical protein
VGSGGASGCVKRAEKASFSFAGTKVVATVWPGLASDRWPKSGIAVPVAASPADWVVGADLSSVALADSSVIGCDANSCPRDESANASGAFCRTSPCGAGIATTAVLSFPSSVLLFFGLASVDSAVFCFPPASLCDSSPFGTLRYTSRKLSRWVGCVLLVTLGGEVGTAGATGPVGARAVIIRAALKQVRGQKLAAGFSAS